MCKFKKDQDALRAAKTKQKTTRIVFSMDELKCQRNAFRSKDGRKWGG